MEAADVAVVMGRGFSIGSVVPWKLEPPSAIAAIRLLMLTGCRKSEILTLRWEYVDLEAGELRLPDSKTGAKVVHLGDPAISVLQGIQRKEDNPWVLPGSKTGKR